ncbi:MAG: glycosyltransferase family 4 protein [Bacteroidetes bacterium]|nr:glycosyltransferase family 4 protein [Bacteroidota bacterium]MBL6943125.1 glycosyltransferase family 4 protein [Bacteroidales bacterium]
MLKNKLEGIGWFTCESLKRIVVSHPEHEFYFIFDRKYNSEFVFADNITPIVVGPPARHPLLHYIWYEISIPRVLKKINPDIFISPDAFLSLSSKYPDLLIIHDLNFEHFPEHMSFIWRKYYKYFTPRYTKKAKRIATVSEFSKQDIVEQYGIDPEKIDVVYNGSGDNFKPVSEEEKEQTRKKYSQGCDYFVFVGALNPRKNLRNIFRAFDSFKTNYRTNIKFVVVGEKMYWTRDIKSAHEKMKHKADVIFTGRLEPENLSKVIGSSVALVYTSFFEGFGIPIIEAFNAEVPVITSNVTSMPEIAGNAALLVDPESVEQITEAMHKVSSDKELAVALVEKGKLRRNDFSWERTAENVWNSIEKIIFKPNK